MPERNEQVQATVRQALEKDPQLSTEELRRMGSEVDPAVGELSLRQFNAGYVLPVKRERASGGAADREAQPPARRSGGARGRPGSAGAGRGQGSEGETGAAARAPRRRGGAEAERDRVRAVLLEFARDLAAAESRSQIVDVMSRLDGYAEQILEARR